MSDLMRIRQGNTHKPVEAIAFTGAGFVDLTVFTGGITFKMTGPATVQGAAAGDAQGNLVYWFAAGQTDVIGVYAATFTGLDASGKPQTFPEGTNLTIEIVAAL